MTEFDDMEDGEIEQDAVDLIRPGAGDHLRMIIEGSIDGILVGNAKGQITHANTAFLNMVGYTEDEIIGRRMNTFFPSEAGAYTSSSGEIVIVDDDFFAEVQKKILTLFEKGRLENWYTYLFHKNRTFVPVEENIVLLSDEDGIPLESVGIIREITDRKRMENELRAVKAELELKVEERTLALEETNVALRVLLQKRDDDRVILEQKIVSNVNELVTPYVQKIRESRLDDKQKMYLQAVEVSLNNIVSPFIQNLSTKFLKLTPTEIQVANFVKNGKTTKDIADILNLSVKTVETHRKNIRKKIGISNRKSNLRAYLLNTENDG
ncbi:MAG: PAS domain S-box protein [Proteobacteria bacterium]|nr:PAS domain S-box protein [Pseudomonadota bacterium]